MTVSGSVTYPPTIVMKVYITKPKISMILVILIQNSASPNHRTDHKLRRPIATRQAEMRMASCRCFQ